MTTTLRQPWFWILLAVTAAATAWTAWQKSPSRMPHPVPPAFERPAREHTDHASLVRGPLRTPSEVTTTCLSCHPDAAREVMATSHWRWTGEPVRVPGHKGTHRIGKKNLLNNFCIGIQGNWPACTKCHAGYGWEDASFDFSDETAVDCLVCHDWSGTYTKGKAGIPPESVDLTAAARSVGYPKRTNCGACHNFGGGGMGVKHGDLDVSLNAPTEFDDVHMGNNRFLCIDCHRTQRHRIAGRSVTVGIDANAPGGFDCTQCHPARPHASARLNAHTDAVACETCHIPTFARRNPTKLFWDWSKAGDDSREDDPHHYLKIKGEFVYGTNVVPEYYWFNGKVNRYLLGDTIDPSRPVELNPPQGDITDPAAKIYPFKVHRAVQPYDAGTNQLVVPTTAGEGGYWSTFDWDKAMALGAQATHSEYSGRYGFVQTVMYWPLYHMVTPADQALQCADCHGEGGRLDWRALGYDGDPLVLGGRK